MTITNLILTVEYDEDGEAVNAWYEDADGQFIKSVARRSDLTKALKRYTRLVDAGRWDGETSAHLAGYDACTSGGDYEKWSK